MAEIIAVDSVVYNMAGEEIDRPQVLKNLVIRNVLSGTKESIATTIINGHLNGGAIKLRSFYRWAENPDNYGEVGMPDSQLQVYGSLDPEAVAPHIPVDSGDEIWVQNARVGYAEIRYWGEQWMLENRPDDYDAAWTLDFDDETLLVTLEIPGDASPVTFTATGFDYEAQYLYARHSTIIGGTEGELVTGDTVTLAPEESFPDMTDWTLTSEDAGPPVHRIYEKQSFINDPDSDQTLFRTETMHQFEDGPDRSYRIDVQDDVYRDFGGLQMFIYKIGSGNATLDALVEDSTDYGEFFPFLPIRLSNTFLSETEYPEAYEQVKKAYRKATGGRLTKLIEQLEDNEDLDDIDHAYIVFGVSLNVLENACKKYLYTFFENLQATQSGGAAAYAAWKAQMEAEQAKVEPWLDWYNSASGDEEPPRPQNNAPPTNYVRIRGTGEINSKYDIRVEWGFVTDGTGSGLGKTGAKVNDLWFDYVGDDTTTGFIIRTNHNGEVLTTVNTNYEKVRLYWQRSASEYTWLEILGLTHRNLVYGGKEVVIKARKAIEDSDESGFIVPLHYDTWREMSLIDTTQMATACVFIVFNCYEVYKTKWYESGIFRVLLVIVIAVVSAVFTGGAGFGLLGANLAVGSALGFTGLTAAIVGSVANALAALVLATIIEKAVGNLGIIGQVLAFVLMFVAGSVAQSFQTGSMAINWGDLLRADNLLRLTDSVGKGIARALQDDTLSLQQETLDYLESSKREIDKIQQAYFEKFGYGAGQIDPFMFTDVNNGPTAESSDTFLTRTLMTGSEIAEMSQELLYGFPEFSLKLPDAFT